jgi:hypothetical protein
MSLIFPEVEAGIVKDQPRLHALVIGVADYPHLLDGSGALARDPLNLGQITTSRHTALRVAEWLMTNYKNPAKPLGSVELLLSPSEEVRNSVGAPVRVEPGTQSNIEQAFKRWRERCSANAENTAFFYFCGHGLQKDEQFLLPQDFGDPNEGSLWRNCINFDATRVGMRSCKAQTQVFFVDACRETPFGVLDKLNVQGQILCDAQFGDKVKCSAAYYATTQGKQAFGPGDGITYFCRAVLKCLDGLASVSSMNKWVVTTYSLAKSLGEVMEHYAEKYNEPLDCNPDVSGQGIVNVPGVGSVIASIQCSSNEANNAAEIELRKNGVSHKVALSEAKPLIREVEPGDWEVEVTFPGGGYPAQPPIRCVLMPAVFEGVDVP